MAKWVSSKIDIYFCDKYGTGEESSLPLLPEEFTCNIKGKNEEIDVLSVGGENNDYTAGTINLLKRPSLKTWTIDCEFSHPDKPTYENNDGEEGWTPAQWVNFFEDAMYNKKILEMTVTGINLVKEVSVEDFKHTKSAGQELDTLYTIELKEYVRSKIEHEDVKIEIVIPQPAKEVKDEVGTKGNTAWLNGIGYKSIVIDADSNIYTGANPYKYIIGTNYNNKAKNNSIFNNSTIDSQSNYDIYYAYFNWLPVKILEKKKDSAESRITLSQLGKYAVEEEKESKYAVANIICLAELLSFPFSRGFDEVLKQYSYDIKYMGKQIEECMPGSEYKPFSNDIDMRCFTQGKKLQEFFHRQFASEYKIDNSKTAINKKYKELSETKKFELAKKYIEMAGTSTEFKTSGTPTTDIVDALGFKHGTMLDFKYMTTKQAGTAVLYKLEAQQSFYLPDTSSNLPTSWTTINKDDNGNITKVDGAISNKTNSVYKTFYDKGTIIYAFSYEIYEGTIQTVNQEATPFTTSKGEKIKSANSIDTKKYWKNS